MFQHYEVHFNYTAYDMRRRGNTLRPRQPTRANVMVLSDPNSEQHDRERHFLYARVIGAYHVNVEYSDPGASEDQRSLERYDFLWVRWYNSGNVKDEYSLESLSFPSMNTGNAFGFIDPEDVVRVTHIIPAFHYGLRPEDASSFSFHAKDGTDWNRYYVGR